jgi:Protein of unknown function (DUF1572)
MTLKFTTSYLEDAIGVFQYYKRLADASISRLSDQQVYEVMDSEMNCIALIMKHLAGNMRSRWVDFLTTDGEKAGRNRDQEFCEAPGSREALLELWEDGWQTLFTALSELSEDDLTRTVTIRGEAHSVMQAVNRQLAHYPYHCGQIVFLAKHLRSADWESLSVPRNRSAEFNRRVAAGEASQR